MPATLVRPDSPDLDIVFAAHKAARRFMFDTLVQIGALDVTDGPQIDLVLDLLERLLVVLGEPRDEWRASIQAVRHGAASQRRGAAAALYRRVAALVARQLAQLEGEEERLRDAPSDAPSLGERLQRLDEDEFGGALHWMAGALTPQELAALLDALHAASDPVRFHTGLALLAHHMDEPRWNRLARALDVSQAVAGAPRSPVGAIGAVVHG